MARRREKPGVMLYFSDIRPAMEMLDDQSFGKLIRAVVEYGEHGVLSELDGVEAFVFNVLRPKIDRDGEVYENKRLHGKYMAYCRQMDDAGRKEKLTEDEYIQQLLVADGNCAQPITSTSTSAFTPVPSLSVGEGAAFSSATAAAKEEAGGVLRGAEREPPPQAAEARDEPPPTLEQFEQRRREAIASLLGR